MNGNLFSEMTAGGDGWYVAHCDGGSRGNPGPSGYGAVVEDPQGRVVARLSEYLGKQTNNFAEYSGLLAVLKWANANGIHQLKVISDSELMVNQMKGRYRVNSPGLKPLWEEAKREAARLGKFQMAHTLRGGNKEADQLANEAMDRGTGRGPASGAASAPGSASAPGAGPALGLGGREHGRVTPAAARSAAPIPIAPRPDARPDATRAQPQRPQRQVFEGLVKNGVVHLIDGELPDGILVKVVRE